MLVFLQLYSRRAVKQNSPATPRIDAYGTACACLPLPCFNLKSSEKACQALGRDRDRVRVVGIQTPLRLYEVLGLTETVSQNQKDAAAIWDKAITLYEERQFAQAVEHFSMMQKQYPNDGTAKLYLQRCSNYINEPPPQDWDAVNNLTEK